MEHGGVSSKIRDMVVRRVILDPLPSIGTSGFRMGRPATWGPKNLKIKKNYNKKRLIVFQTMIMLKATYLSFLFDFFLEKRSPGEEPPPPSNTSDPPY